MHLVSKKPRHYENCLYFRKEHKERVLLEEPFRTQAAGETGLCSVYCTQGQSQVRPQNQSLWIDQFLRSSFSHFNNQLKNLKREPVPLMFTAV